MVADEARVAVLILCRVSAGESARRLGNVLAIGPRSLVVEIDDPPAAGASVSIAFVVPGTGARVALDGKVLVQETSACVVNAPVTSVAELAEFVSRRQAPSWEVERP